MLWPGRRRFAQAYRCIRAPNRNRGNTPHRISITSAGTITLSMHATNAKHVPLCRAPVPLISPKQKQHQFHGLGLCLIVLLNLYGLACTLFAAGCGGFWEMDPFAGYILDVPPMVVCFKLGLTIGPAILLIIARRRKLAQMASWRGGVLYTVLVLRWVTYNAMFMH